MFCNTGKANHLILTCGFPLASSAYLNLFLNHLPSLILSLCKPLQPPVYFLLEGQSIIFPTRQWICASRHIFFLPKSAGLRKVNEIQTRLNSTGFRCRHECLLKASSLTLCKKFLLWHTIILLSICIDVPAKCRSMCSSTSFQVLFVTILWSFLAPSSSFLFPFIHLCLNLCWALL